MRDTAVISRGSETDSRSSVVPSFDSYAVDLSSHNANPHGVFDGEAVPLSDLADTRIEESVAASGVRRRARLALDRRELDRGRNAAV